MRLLPIGASFYLEAVDLRVESTKALWFLGDSWYLRVLSDIIIFIVF
jgi:hypothetical protein